MLTKINEIKSVTVDNHEFENYGWCFVIVGSPGSGKSYFIKNKLLGQGKIFDIDDFRERYKKLLKQKNKKVPSFKELQTFCGEKITQSEKNFLNAQQNYKGNIIFDLAGRPGKRGEPSQLETLIGMVKQFGYKVAIVWVVTNRSVAMKRNIERGLTKERAIIPDKSFHQRTNQTNKFMPTFLQSSYVGNNVDLSYIVFSSSYSLNDMSDNEKQNCVITLPKEGDRFVISPQIMDYITKVLGPKETSNGFTPEVYKTNSQVRNILKTGEKYNDFLKQSEPINEKRVIRIDENKLTKLISECVKEMLLKKLNEGISSVVYHYTHPENFISMVKSNEMESSDDGGISVTRSRNDNCGYAIQFRKSWCDGAYVRLQLDGDMLNNNCKGISVDEFGRKSNAKTWWYKNDSNEGFYTQSEDKFFPRNGVLKNLVKYVKRVDIMLLSPDEYDFSDGMYQNIWFISKLYNLAKGTEWENLIRIYIDRDDFNSQRNGTTLEYEYNLIKMYHDDDYDSLNN